MKNFKRNLKIFFLFSQFSLKTTLQARVGVLFLLLGKLIRFLFFLSLIYLIFFKINLLKGYHLNQVIIFYLTFNLIDTISQILFREVYRFRYLVTSGNFDMVLIKPHHPFLRILVGGIDYLDIIMIIPYLGLTLFFAFQSSSIYHLTSIVLYFVLIINSLLIATAFHIAVLAFGILTTEVDQPMLIYRDITNLGRFPIDIYQKNIRAILTFVIPVAVMMTFPARALFNLLNPSLIAFAFLISLGLFTLSLKFWNIALKRYQAWGG